MSTDKLNLGISAIIAAKRGRLAQRQGKIPASAVIALATMQKHANPILNFVTTRDEIALIGQIRHAEIYDPVAAALRYMRYGVSGISLFTDETIYSKGMDDLTLVARGISKPLIAQDYILNEYHVAEARAAGASALVLYASILDKTDLRRVVSITQRWRMTSIVQVATEAELEYAAQLSPHVIAIGRPQLFDPAYDLELLRRLHPLVPFNSRVMSLACIQTNQDVEDVVGLGVDAVIVDEVLLKQPAMHDQLMKQLAPSTDGNDAG